METSAAALPNAPVSPTVDQADSVKKVHEQIDRITYLASLASKFEDVDPMMDDLRGVTAVWDGSSPLTITDEQKLDDLEARLKHYLITADPLRTFTAETLNQRLEGRLHKPTLNPAAKSVLVILLASLAAAGLSYLPFIPLSADNRVFIAIPSFFVALHIGISWLYLTTLKNFNDEVRKAFRLVVTAVILFSLAFSQYAVIAAFGQDLDAPVLSATTTWLVAAPYFFIYFGMRTYARQLGIRSWVSKLPIVALGWIAVMAIRVLLPHDAGDQNFYLWAPGAVSFTYLTLLSLILVRQIRKSVTSAYARPMTWMYTYLIVNFLASAAANTPDNGTGDNIYTMMLLFGVPVQLLLLMTGYSFKKELSK